jgi:hypothetical protein
MHRPRKRSILSGPELLEDRITPTISFGNVIGADDLGANVQSFAVGDLNGDGKPDIVAGSVADFAGTAVLTNKGTLTFSNTETIKISTDPYFSPFYVKLADLTGNGKLDLVMAGDNQLVICMGNGNGTFQTKHTIIDTLPYNIQDMAIADLNGDGKPDLVLAMPGGMAVLLNNGSSTIFSPPTYYNVSNGPDQAYLAVGDFTGDGKTDIAVSVYSQKLIDVYLNNGNGTFGAPTAYYDPSPVTASPGHLLAGDFYNDSNLDLVVGYVGTSDVGLLKGNGDGTFQNPVVIDTTAQSSNGAVPLAAADFDHDGNLDLLVSGGEEDGSSGVILPGNGNGTFGTPIPVSAAGGVYAVADLNGDNLPDIVYVTSFSPGGYGIEPNTSVVTFGSTAASFASPTVSVGGSDTLTIDVNNVSGQPVSDLTNSDFALTMSGGSSAGVIGTVTGTSTPGTYTVNFTGNHVGAVSTVEVTVDGVKLPSEPTVKVVSAVPAGNSSVSFAKPTVPSGTIDTATITLQNAQGFPISGLPSSAFSFALSGGTSTGSFGAVTETATPGTYTANFTGIVAGTVQSLLLKVDGILVASHPSVQVKPGAVSATNTQVRFAGSTVKSGATDPVIIVLKDAAGNVVSGLTSGDFSLGLMGGTSSGSFGQVNPSATSGRYTAVFTAFAAGTASKLSTTIDGIPIAVEPEVTVLPATLTVTNLNDSGTGSLAAAIAAADLTSNDVIKFENGLHGEIDLLNGELLISSNMTIDGPGASKLSISGQDDARVFEIDAGFKVGISGLTITHGSALDEGGGILNDGSNLTLSGDDITKNVATESTDSVFAEGGGLQSLNGIVTIAKCEISDNQTLGISTATQSGDAEGAGLEFLGGSAMIDNSSITGNESIGDAGSSDGQAAGGGIFSLVSLKISGTTISGNEALGGNNSSEASGVNGGIIIEASSGSAFGAAILSGADLSLDRCTVDQNKTMGGNDAADGTAQGGAIIAIDSGSLILANCTLSENLSEGGESSGGLADQGYAGGGAIAVFVPTTITNTSFTDNKCVGGNNGVQAYVGEAIGGAAEIGALATIRGSAFSGNEAVGGSDGNSGTGAVDPGVDESFGGAISTAYEGDLLVSATTFTNNEAIGGNDAVATGSDIVEAGVAEGGTVCNEGGSTAVFSKCTFTGNEAVGGNGNSATGPVVDVGTGFGAGIFNGFGETTTEAGDSLIVTDSTFSKNQATGGNGNSSTASVAGLVGDGVGGAIMNYLGGTATITGSTLNSNEAISGTSNTASGAGTAFVNSGMGGAIMNGLGNYDSTGYGQFGATTLVVNDSSIDSNEAEGAGEALGGGIANLLTGTVLTADSSFGGNKATSDSGGTSLGGGIYNDSTSSLSLSETQVIGNRATGTTGSGGGIDTPGSFTDDSLTIIANNKASTSDANIGL